MMIDNQNLNYKYTIIGSSVECNRNYFTISKHERTLPLQTNIWGTFYNIHHEIGQIIKTTTHFNKANKITTKTNSIEIKWDIQDIVVTEYQMRFTDIRIFERRTGYEFQIKKMVIFRRFMLCFFLHTMYIRIIKLYYDSFFFKPNTR
jgi:hypothetical protein